MRNLRHEAQQRGIAAERLLFAQRRRHLSLQRAHNGQ
jgi:hypothetical protein